MTRMAEISWTEEARVIRDKGISVTLLLLAWASIRRSWVE